MNSDSITCTKSLWTRDYYTRISKGRWSNHYYQTLSINKSRHSQIKYTYILLNFVPLALIDLSIGVLAGTLHRHGNQPTNPSSPWTTTLRVSFLVQSTLFLEPGDPFPNIGAVFEDFKLLCPLITDRNTTTHCPVNKIRPPLQVHVDS